MKRQLDDKIDHAKDSAKRGFKSWNVGQKLSNFAKAENKPAYIGRGIKNGVTSRARRFGGRIKNNTTETGKKIINTVKAIIRVVKALLSWKVAILVGIICISYTIVVFVLSLADGVEPTPHYYCDLEADKTVKRTSLYTQYCKKGNGSDFYVDNINGHYLVQDGEGPDTACAIGNMVLRYYNTDTRKFNEGTNLFKFLWQSDGQYNTIANTIGKSDGESSSNIRSVLNGYSDDVNTESAFRSTPHGSIEFASKHNKGSSYNMSNWGYLKDDSVDYAAWETGTNFYDPSNQESDKWVWDLSLGNKSKGTTWLVPNEITENNMGNAEELSFRIGFSRCRVETARFTMSSDLDKKIEFLQKIRDILDKEGIYEYNKGSAGVVARFHDTATGKYHSILLTGYDSNGTDSFSDDNWYGVDSKLGTLGGFVGPLEDPNFSVTADIYTNRSNGAKENVSYAEDALNNYYHTYTNDNGHRYEIVQIWYCVGSKFSVPSSIFTIFENEE